MLGVDIPVSNELHVKSGIEDVEGVLARNAPLVICADEQSLHWDKDEKEFLSEDEKSSWLLDKLPFGAHARPEGALDAQSLLVLWDTHNEETKPIFPLEIDPMAAEIALRGLRRIIPRMQKYIERMPRPFIDGGYYTKTKENRPLACPLPVKGAYVIGAASGYGIMAAAALGELVALHISKEKLPDYAPLFSLERYQDKEYLELLRNWGDSWQL
jgi:glycine/D-amino acid oxidase-like deaminating enzyme